MNDNPEAFLKKSRENLEVCDSAMADEKFNAAASRYYYALRLAAISYFWAKGIKPPDKIWERGREVKNTENKWPHPKLINRVGEVLPSGMDAKNLLRSAKDLRIKGDYKDIDVDKHELPKLRKLTDEVLDVLLGDGE